MVLFGAGEDVVAAALDLYAVDETAPFVRVVVDDTADVFIDLAGLVDVSEDHLAGVAGADQHDVDGFARGLATADSRGAVAAEVGCGCTSRLAAC